MDGAHLAHRPLDRTAPRGDRPAERNGVLHVDIIIIARGGGRSCGGYVWWFADGASGPKNKSYPRF